MCGKEDETDMQTMDNPMHVVYSGVMCIFTFTVGRSAKDQFLMISLDYIVTCKP